MSGPFETLRQAQEYAVACAGVSDPLDAIGASRNRRMMLAAIEAAGVELGTYDRKIIDWLAGFEPFTCAVIAGLITRAHAPLTAQQAGLLAQVFTDATEYRLRDIQGCRDCAAALDGICDRHGAELERTTEYEELAEAMAARGDLPPAPDEGD
jgi:hypothetical protein